MKPIPPPQFIPSILESAHTLPPILTPEQFAVVVDRTPGAIYHLSSNDGLAGAARHRGRRLLIFRDRALTLAAGGKLPPLKGHSLQLTTDEIESAFSIMAPADRWPLLLSPGTLGTYLNVGRSSVYRWVAFGFLDDCFTKSTRSIRFARNLVLAELFNGVPWNDDPS